MFKWITVLVLVFTIGLLGYWIIQKLENGPNDLPHTTLELTSGNLSPAIGKPFDVSVNINTNQNIVSEVLIQVRLNPEIAQVTSLKSGGNFEIDISSIQIQPDRVTFRAKSKAPEFTGTGTISTLSLRGVSAGILNLSYSDRTIVGAATPQGENVLGSTTPMTITIVDN